jgi:hypothetical protein
MRRIWLAGSWMMMLVLVCQAQEGIQPFLGKWNMAGDGKLSDHIYWLEVKSTGDKPEILFLDRGGSPFKPDNALIQNGLLSFTVKGKQPQPFEARMSGNKMVGTYKTEKETIQFTGVRPPVWSEFNANAKHKFGPPLELFDGKSIKNWTFQNKKEPSGWEVVDGILQNQPSADNLISIPKFFNFKIQIEYKLEPKSNSGIYLRGRYELQVLDDYGKPADVHGHMAIYGRTPTLVNASKPAGEWQAMEAVVVGNRVTVHLNGKKVHTNQVIEGITGGCLDGNEMEPGPLMIQGDHGRIWLRKVTIIPIL